jgi:hypothetical protein
MEAETNERDAQIVSAIDDAPAAFLACKDQEAVIPSVRAPRKPNRNVVCVWMRLLRSSGYRKDTLAADMCDQSRDLIDVRGR